MGNSYINLELNLPVQNILGTYIRYSEFEDLVMEKKEPVIEKEESEIDKKYLLASTLMNQTDSKKKYNQLIHIDTFKKQIDLFQRSDVLIATKPHISVYPGMPPTGRIAVKKIHYFPAVLCRSNVEKIYSQHIKMLQILMHLNNLDVFHFSPITLKSSRDSVNHAYRMLIKRFGRPRGINGSEFHISRLI